ncbi:MAG: Clp protease ClpP [Verrucomicrobiales bacterium]|nr:Clp protease ClpP [Verrucomicrobiales bacterium]
MSIRKLPEAKAPAKPKNFQWDAPSDVLAKWAERPQAAEADEPNTISIYDVIGEDWWTGGGFTAARMAAALRSIGRNAVTVNVNSPGGDMFEGIAIYNLLREHPERVTVNVMGLAASAASIIAMAGDEIRMGLGTFLMIHNAWGVVIGNRHDMRDAAELFDGFDSALADIYEARTETERAEIVRLMDRETFMGPSDAVDRGFADVVDDGLEMEDGPDNRIDKNLMARRQTEAALARAGFSRGDRSQMIAALGGQRDATSITAARDAGDLNAGLRGLIDTLKN